MTPIRMLAILGSVAGRTRDGRETSDGLIILDPAMGSHAKAQRRKEVEFTGNHPFTYRVSAEKVPTLCAFAPLRDILSFHRRI